MIDHTRHSPVFLGVLSLSLTQNSGRLRYPHSRDQKQERRELLPFTGDDAASPPLAWTWLWKGTYRNLFGGYVSKHLQLDGYVMWDAARIEDTQLGERLKNWLEDELDPRDDL